MRYFTITEFKNQFVAKQAHAPFMLNREGEALTALAKAERIQIQKAPGIRCAKLKGSNLEYVNSYPTDLLMRFYGNQLNAAGLQLKSEKGDW